MLQKRKFLAHLRDMITRGELFLLISVLFLSSFVSTASAWLAIGGDLTWIKDKMDIDDSVVTNKLHQVAPTTDAAHFTDNFLAVYDYSSSIVYKDEGSQDYWQSASETIQLGQGDCEDYSILLATLIEVLYEQTFGYIPRNLVWVAIGEGKSAERTTGHAWVIVNTGLLPSETINRIKSVPTSNTIIIPILGWKIDMPSYAKKSDYGMFIEYDGDHYFELEATWHCPISQFYYYKYPFSYSRACLIVNSQEGYWYPTFYTVNEPRSSKADIIDVDFPQVVYVNHGYSIRVTVKNYDCGIMGADLHVCLYDIERGEKYEASQYVSKNSETTFTFNLLPTEQCAVSGIERFSLETEHFSLELYWRYNVGFYDQYYLQDWMSIEFEIKFYLPDLEIHNIWIEPVSPKSGNEVIFYADGQNSGPVNSGPWDVYLYLDGELIDTGSVPDVPAGSGFNTQSDPWVATAGIHTVRYVVDATDRVSESNEYNNEMSLTFTVEEVREESFISCKVSQYIDTSSLSGVNLGEQVCINGRIIPEVGTAPVTIYYKIDDDSWSILEDSAGWYQPPEGGYIYYYYWNPPTVGTYYFKASWSGNSEYLGAESGLVSLIVEEAGAEETFSFVNLQELFFVDGCFTASFGYGAEANTIDTVGGTLVSAWFSSHATGGTNVDVMTDNEVTSARDVSGPMISVGGPAVNLFWSEYNTPSSWAYFSLSGTEWAVVADGNEYHKSGKYVYEGGSENGIVTDYAIIELIWDEESNRPVLLIAGISGHATKAACEWFYNEANNIINEETSAFVLEIMSYGNGTWISTIGHMI